MALAKSEAIVLKSQKQGETTKILTLYTRAFGKIQVIAKGARSIKGKFWGSLETLNYISIVFYRKENRDLQFLSQADIINPFLRIRTELGRMSLAMIACEWINRGEQGESKNPQLFQLLVELLSGLNEADSGLKNVLRCFQLHFLELHGFKPQLEQCADCLSQDIGDFAYFQYEDGSYHCDKCGNGEAVKISTKVFQVLRWLSEVRPDKIRNTQVAASTGDEIDELINKFAHYHIESLGALKVPEVLAQISEHLKKK